MKKLTTTFIIISLINIYSLPAQSYLPLFTIDTTEWNVHVVGVNGVFDASSVYTYNVDTIETDTVIYNNLNDTLKISINTNNSRAWLYLEEFDKEILVYDISLAQTDSFKLYSYYGIQIDSSWLYVDTIYYQNNRKVIEFQRRGDFYIENEDATWQFAFIEGVGPINFFNYGRQTSNEMWDYPHIVLCKLNNNITEYAVLTNSDCEITNIYNRGFSAIEIYPNPTNSHVYVKSTLLKNVVAFDIFGTQQQINFQKNVMDISNLQNGVYFIIVEDFQGKKYYSKIIKN